jgi:hypothetical protein
MIDWPLVLFSAVWLSGAALGLAVLSYASWSASTSSERLRVVLQRPRYQCALLAAACLICTGLGLTATTWLETLLWIMLAFSSAVALISLWRTARRKRQP